MGILDKLADFFHPSSTGNKRLDRGLALEKEDAETKEEELREEADEPQTAEMPPEPTSDEDDDADIADEGVVSNGPALEPQKKKGKRPRVRGNVPTRDQVAAVARQIITGAIPNRLGIPYQNIRETGGPNRSPAIDAIIRKHGGGVGQPYCQYGQQELLDAICAHYGVNRARVRLPVGGSTQGVYNMVPAKYKRRQAAPMCWITWSAGPGKGHVGMVFAAGRRLSTFEFNTTASKSRVIRNGQGAAWCDRSPGSLGRMRVRGFVDVYQALADAMS
jgi:hypothetical protein